MNSEIKIIDGFLLNPELYRDAALTAPFQSYHFEKETFHGIYPLALTELVPARIADRFPHAEPTLSFLRKSPLGQVEPHFIHTDIDMGEWSSILYLNPNPPDGDGTTFWTHSKTGTIGSMVPHERSEEGMTSKGWVARESVQAKFNRMVIWPSWLFHSRSIPENWGEGDEARLTQVTFGKGGVQ